MESVIISDFEELFFMCL